MLQKVLEKKAQALKAPTAPPPPPPVQPQPQLQQSLQQQQQKALPMQMTGMHGESCECLLKCLLGAQASMNHLLSSVILDIQSKCRCHWTSNEDIAEWLSMPAHAPTGPACAVVSQIF